MNEQSTIPTYLDEKIPMRPSHPRQPNRSAVVVAMRFGSALVAGTLLTVGLVACEQNLTGIDGPKAETLMVHLGAITLASIGDTVTVQAEVLDGMGRAIPDVPLAWRIEGDSILEAIPDAPGTFRSIRNGAATLVVVTDPGTPAVNRARGYFLSALERRIPVLVQQVPVGIAIRSSNSSTIWSLGDQRIFQVRVVDARGTEIEEQLKDVRWRSENPEVVEVNEQGVVRAISDGPAWVSASLGALEATEQVNVQASFDLEYCHRFEGANVNSCNTIRMTVTERTPSGE
jgi:hypothetical protein